MQSSVRFRYCPTKQQKATLLQWIGVQRFVYNAKLRLAKKVCAKIEHTTKNDAIQG